MGFALTRGFSFRVVRVLYVLLRSLCHCPRYPRARPLFLSVCIRRVVDRTRSLAVVYMLS